MFLLFQKNVFRFGMSLNYFLYKEESKHVKGEKILI